jgi:hypothetical protein
MELIKRDLLAGLNSVVNTDGDGDQQKANVTFPNRPHIHLSSSETRAKARAVYAFAHFS